MEDTFLQYYELTDFKEIEKASVSSIKFLLLLILRDEKFVIRRVFINKEFLEYYVLLNIAKWELNCNLINEVSLEWACYSEHFNLKSVCNNVSKLNI